MLASTGVSEKMIKAAKIAVGALAAILIATALGLQNGITTGIITLLSIQDTKTETVVFAGKRLIAYFVAVLIAYASFSLIGFNAVAFSVFLLFFTVFCIFANVPESLSVCAVLVTHFLLAGHMRFALVLNEFLILLIGAGIGVVLNFITTTRIEEIRKTQESIDAQIKNILLKLSALVLHKASSEEVANEIDELDSAVLKAISRAEQLDKNYLLTDYSYYPSYLALRKNQASLLMRFVKYNYMPEEISNEERIISVFLEKIADSFHECNDGVQLSMDATQLLEEFSVKPVPETREDFESRAILYGQLVDLESLIMLKRNFVFALTEGQRRQYWSQCKQPPAMQEG